MPPKGDAQPRAWQRMLSGRRLDLLDPSPLDIEIGDIAHGLARVARWNGQTSGAHAFSVAQHSLLVEDIFCVLVPSPAAPDMRLAALLHDAPEYVVGDMISPFKAVVGGGYKAVEQRLMDAVHLRFSLPIKPDARLIARIKRADQVAAYLEATALAGFSHREAAAFFGRPNGLAIERFDLAPRPAEEVQADFLLRFADIERERVSARPAPAGRGTTG
ncbi:MAG TPA: HD family hydrolase [Mesorhizobium sp.]|jgi:hypothetical protein|nr:HD family hydrolase [Mesorhizobium sp.]